ncbi:MAG: UTP--glucose-1-phosphate uridylyltransferase [Flavobacteriaceae bacterium]|nr:UTP--glucose-1-phosphate uridylyltransferase [Flavobacteriaceae bacterium]
MAAGSGSRYGKLKQFDDLGPAGEFLMEFSISDAITNGFDHIVIITKAANKTFLEEHLTPKLPEHIKLDVLVQDLNDLPEGVNVVTGREKPWGTAHAVWTARHVINSDFVIINADDYYGQKALKAASEFINNSANASTYGLVGYRLNDTLSAHGAVSRGVCEADNGRLTSIIERTKITANNGKIIDEDSGVELEPESVVSMNLWICNPSIFKYIETYFKTFLENEKNLEKGEIYIPFVAQEMMSNGLIDINVMDAQSLWFGVTYYADKAEAVATLAKLTEDGSYPSPLWN